MAQTAAQKAAALKKAAAAALKRAQAADNSSEIAATAKQKQTAQVKSKAVFYVRGHLNAQNVSQLRQQRRMSPWLPK